VFPCPRHASIRPSVRHDRDPPTGDLVRCKPGQGARSIAPCAKAAPTIRSESAGSTRRTILWRFRGDSYLRLINYCPYPDPGSSPTYLRSSGSRVQGTLGALFSARARARPPRSPRPCHSPAKPLGTGARLNINLPLHCPPLLLTYLTDFYFYCFLVHRSPVTFPVSPLMPDIFGTRLDAAWSLGHYDTQTILCNLCVLNARNFVNSHVSSRVHRSSMAASTVLIRILLDQ